MFPNPLSEIPPASTSSYVANTHIQMTHARDATVLRLSYYLALYIDKNVSEKHIASIFRVDFGYSKFLRKNILPKSVFKMYDNLYYN